MKIWSGGQTGVDMGALYGARDAGVETGGWAPRGWMTERGPQKELLIGFGLIEHTGGYDHRTAANIADADGTLIIGDIKSPGSALTARLCQESGKPWRHLTDAQEVVAWVRANGIVILNVAGNRESKAAGIQVWTRGFVAWLCRKAG